MNNQQQRVDGVTIVASRKESFYLSALFLAESIRDYAPHLKMCLVVDEHLIDDRADTTFDKVIFTPYPDDYRAKLWGMSQSPWDRTLYLDADMECVSEDISNVFEELKDNDMMFTEITDVQRPVFMTSVFPAGRFTYNGGVCLYNSSKERVKEFMYHWWVTYTKQYSGEWWPIDPVTGERDLVNYGPYEEMKGWDQFTLWWMTNRDPDWSDLKIGIIPDGARYNAYTRFTSKMLNDKEPVLIHHSISLQKDNVEAYRHGL